MDHLALAADGGCCHVYMSWFLLMDTIFGEWGRCFSLRLKCFATPQVKKDCVASCPPCDSSLQAKYPPSPTMNTHIPHGMSSGIDRIEGHIPCPKEARSHGTSLSLLKELCRPKSRMR